MNFLKKLLLRAVTILVFGVIGVTVFIRQESNFSKYCSAENPCDAVVAISGGNTVARAEYAGKILASGVAEYLIFSGANSDPNVISDAETMAAFAEDVGADQSDMILEKNARNTFENARLAAQIIKDRGWKKIILTTSPYHQRRALLEFRKALEDYEVEIYNAPATNDPEWRAINWFLSGRGWYLTVSEFVGIIIFYLR